MPTFWPSVPDNLREWALAQPVFFTATAPTYGAHINLSPKGHTSSSLAVLSPNTCAYLDGTGSGCETAAHLRENGRITLMWCSFGASPRIMRWFGRGRVIERGTTTAKGCAAFEEAVERMRAATPSGKLDPLPVGAGKGAGGDGTRGWRAVIVIDIFKVQTSCGFGVPVMTGLPAPNTSSKPATAAAGESTAPDAKTNGSATQTAKDAAAADVPENLQELRASVQQVAAAEAAEVEKGARSAYAGPPYVPRQTMANYMALLDREDGNKAKEYQAEWNVNSLDGLPGYQSARRTRLFDGPLTHRVRSARKFAALGIRNKARQLRGMGEGVLLGLVLGVFVGLFLALGVDGALALLNDWLHTARKSVSGGGGR